MKSKIKIHEEQNRSNQTLLIKGENKSLLDKKNNNNKKKKKQKNEQWMAHSVYNQRLKIITISLTDELEENGQASTSKLCVSS